MAEVFEVDVILVMGHDRLYAELTASMASIAAAASGGGPSPVVVKLPRSGGVVQVRTDVTGVSLLLPSSSLFSVHARHERAHSLLTVPHAVPSLPPSIPARGGLPGGLTGLTWGGGRGGEGGEIFDGGTKGSAP